MREPVAHGPAGTLEEPDWPPLTLNEADSVLRQFPEAGGALRLVTVSPRPFSAASVVETPHGLVFVKRHHAAVRSRAGLLEEHRLQQYLAGAQWPNARALVQAPLPHRGASGETVAVQGEWVYEVHPLAEGADLYREAHSWTSFVSTDHARAAGQALAALHLALEGYGAPPRAIQPLVTSWTIFAGADPMPAMAAYLEQRPALREYAEARNWGRSMEELLLPWHRGLLPYLPHLKPLWTHNDFHASNLMWCEDAPHAAVTAIVDFGLSDRTNAVHDVATAIERNAIAWLRMGETGMVPTVPSEQPMVDQPIVDQPTVHQPMVYFDQIDALLAGYESVRPLEAMERQAVAVMLPLVHCEFALSETDYFLSVLHDSTKARLGYQGYFLGHAAWFRSSEGAKLLRHLERWADSREDGEKRP